MHWASEEGLGRAVIPGALSFGRIIIVLFYFCLLCGYSGKFPMGQAIAQFGVSAGSYFPFSALSLHLRGWTQMAMIILPN